MAVSEVRLLFVDWPCWDSRGTMKLLLRTQWKAWRCVRFHKDLDHANDGPAYGDSLSIFRSIAKVVFVSACRWDTSCSAFKITSAQAGWHSHSGSPTNIRFVVLVIVLIMLSKTAIFLQFCESTPQYCSKPFPSSFMISVVKHPSCLLRSRLMTSSWMGLLTAWRDWKTLSVSNMSWCNSCTSKMSSDWTASHRIRLGGRITSGPAVQLGRTKDGPTLEYCVQY